VSNKASDGTAHRAISNQAAADQDSPHAAGKDPDTTGQLLPLPLPSPDDRIQRLVLFAVRRMAAHGVRDAYAANLLFSNFGINFRRPLVLLRAFMIELSQTSKRTITIAPCCALRMTLDEGRIVTALATAASNRISAAKHLRELAGDSAIASPLSVAVAFNNSLADLGWPLRA
jgi:hypothetical protein